MEPDSNGKVSLAKVYPLLIFGGPINDRFLDIALENFNSFVAVVSIYTLFSFSRNLTSGFIDSVSRNLSSGFIDAVKNSKDPIYLLFIKNLKYLCQRCYINSKKKLICLIIN